MTYSACVPVFFVSLFLLLPAEASGQVTFAPTYTASDSAEWMRETGFSFSLSQREDVARLMKVRKTALLEATLALEKFARKGHTSDDNEPRNAANVLIAIGGGDARALAALCDTLLTLKTYDDWEGGHPLSEFKSAHALIAIGGSRARQAIFDSLRKPLDQRGLLIRAHVLAEIDPPRIMCEHIKMAIAKQEERQRIGGVKIDERYLGYLRQLHDWLNDPEFLQNRKNWP